jgi:hypothetical protein
MGSIPAELIGAGVKCYTLWSINILMLFGIKKNCYRGGSNLLFYL